MGFLWLWSFALRLQRLGELAYPSHYLRYLGAGVLLPHELIRDRLNFAHNDVALVRVRLYELDEL